MGRTGEYRLSMTVIGLVCVLGALSSVLPVVEYAVNLVLVIAGVVALLVATVRRVARVVRERREDREDEITAAAWRAAHRPAAVS